MSDTQFKVTTMDNHGNDVVETVLANTMEIIDGNLVFRNRNGNIVAVYSGWVKAVLV